MPSISEEEYMKQQKVVAKELEKLLKTPYFLKKMRYLDFIKEMKQVMEKCRKNITVTNEELDIARKILTGETCGWVNSCIKMGEEYDDDLYDIKKGQIKAFIGHGDEIYDIIVYLRAEYFIEGMKQQIARYAIPGCTYQVYYDDLTLLGYRTCCPRVYLGITYNEKGEEPEEFYYRVNPALSNFMSYQAHVKVCGEFDDAVTKSIPLESLEKYIVLKELESNGRKK